MAEARGQPRADDPDLRPIALDAAERYTNVEDTYRGLVEAQSIITGTPKSVVPKIRNVLEYLRPGSIFLWDGDGSMSHEDAMRSLRLMGSEVLPAIREIGDELGLAGPFAVDPATNEPPPPPRG